MLALDLATTNRPPEAKRSDFHYKDPQTPLRQKKIKKKFKKIKNFKKKLINQFGAFFLKGSLSFPL